jgi:hypothetical protein
MSWIHNEPPNDSGAFTPADWAYMLQLGETLITSIEQIVVTALLGVSVFGVKPFAALQNFGNEALGTVTSVESLISGVGGATINDVIALLNGLVQTVNTILHGAGLPGLGNIPPVNPPSSLPGLNSSLSQLGTILQSSLTGLQSAVVNNFDGGAAAVNGIIFNYDGGAQVTFSPNITSPLAVIVHNMDGGATGLRDLVFNNDGGAFISQVATAGPGLLSRTDGGATSLAQAVQNDFTAGVATAQQITGGIESSIHNAVGSLVGGLFGAWAAPAPATNPVNQVVVAAGAIQQRLQTIGNGAEEQVDVEFSGFTNGAIPGIFTLLSGSSGTAPIVQNGQLYSNRVAGNHSYLYNPTPTLTDYQQISGELEIVATAAGLLGRSNAPGDTLIKASYSNPAWTLSASVSGSTVFSVVFDDNITQLATYTLVCGDPTLLNPYKFSILKNGSPLALTSVTTGDTSQPAGQLYYVDTSQASTVGGSNRSCGLFMVTGTGQVVAFNNFLFQDTAQSLPSVLVTTSESTASTTYTDLATTSDEVAVNIGTRGLALVCLYYNTLSTANQLGLMSFAASGANTIAASDTAAIGSNTTANENFYAGAPFVLTGLTPGLTVFKAKYRSVAAGSVAFANRRVGVVAL